MLKIFTQGTEFRDESGRQRIFNGVNLNDKGNHDDGGERRSYKLDFDEELISTLAGKGVNLVRLGVTWDAVEPEPGQYNEEFIDKMQAVADLCEKYSIYFYIDMHQDLYSGAKGTAGDGAPPWACITDGAKFTPPKLVWAEGYFWGKATHRAFDAFWMNKKVNGVPLQTYFCNMWKHLAERFGDHPALFGFDFLNEPFPGSEGGKAFRQLIAGVAKTVICDKRCNIPSLAKTLMSGNVIGCLEPFADYSLFRKATSGADETIKKFDTGYYSKFINRVAEAVREATDNGIIMMENSYYSNLGIPYSTPAVTVNGEREKKLCFAPHAYDIMVDTPEYKYASNTRVGGIFDEHRTSQLRLQVPVIVGEWGGASEGTDWLYHIEYLLNKFDSYQWGHTYWCYYDGLLDNPIMTCLERTAPVAVCGTIEKYGWDKEKQEFSIKYSQDKEYQLPTEIYLHKIPTEVLCDCEYKICGNKLLVPGETGEHSITIRY